MAGGAGTLRLVALDGGAGRPRELLPLRATPLALAVHAASRTLAVLCAPAASQGEPQAGGTISPGCGGVRSSSGDGAGGAASEHAGSWMDGEDSEPGDGRGGAAGDSGDERGGRAGQHGDGGMMSSTEREQDRGSGRHAAGGGGAEGAGAGRRDAPHELRCIDPATGVAGHLHTQQAGCPRSKHC